MAAEPALKRTEVRLDSVVTTSTKAAKKKEEPQAGRVPLKVVQGNPNATADPNAARPDLKILPKESTRPSESTAEKPSPPVNPVRLRPQPPEKEKQEQQEFHPSAFNRLFGVPLPTRPVEQGQGDQQQVSAGVIPINSYRARQARQQAQEQAQEQAQVQGGRAGESEAMEALDEALAFERKEFIYGIFWPSFIEFPVVNLIGWYFYWFVTSVTDVPEAFRLAKWQKIVVVAATAIEGLLILVLLVIIMAYVCTGVTGFFVRNALSLTGFSSTSAVCTQFSVVFDQVAQTILK